MTVECYACLNKALDPTRAWVWVGKARSRAHGAPDDDLIVCDECSAHDRKLQEKAGPVLAALRQAAEVVEIDIIADVISEIACDSHVDFDYFDAIRAGKTFWHYEPFLGT